MLLGSFQKGLYLSRDAGTHVTAVRDQGTSVATAFDPDNPRTAVASVVDYSAQEFLLYRTTDAARSWSSKPVPFQTNQIRAQANSGRMWAATDRGVFLSEDDGARWRLSGLNGQQMLAIALHPARPDTVYAGGKEGSLSKSVDGGKTWQPVLHPAWPDGCEVHALIVHPIDPNGFSSGLMVRKSAFIGITACEAASGPARMGENPGKS